MIETVAEVASTNAELLARLAAGGQSLSGRWLVADRQTAGRGRLGRAWHDGFGNFMGSTVIDPGPRGAEASQLALVVGIALYAAVQSIATSSGQAGQGGRGGLPGLVLKWPNDLLVGEAKLAGILLERSRDAVVAGIGVNLAIAPILADRATTSLAANDVIVSRDAFAVVLAAHVAAHVARWQAGGWPDLRDEWEARAIAPGTPLVLKGREGPIHGTFAGLAPHGAALLALPDGGVFTVEAGELEIVAGGPPRGKD